MEEDRFEEGLPLNMYRGPQYDKARMEASQEFHDIAREFAKKIVDWRIKYRKAGADDTASRESQLAVMERYI